MDESMKGRKESLCTLRRHFPHIAALTRGNRDPSSATPSATISENTQGFVPESVNLHVLT